MYINNQDAIDKAKNNLVDIIKKYFVQNDNAKKLENAIQSIKAQNLDSFNTSIDKLISQLSKQQNQLLAQQSNLNKTNISAEGSKMIKVFKLVIAVALATLVGIWATKYHGYIMLV